VQTSPTRPERPLGVPAITRAATAVASRPRTSVAVLAAAFLLLSLALASGAGASVYWTNTVGPVFGLPGTTIGRVNNDGTGINQNFIGGASTPTAVAVDAAHVYWLNDDDHSIGRANLDGTGVNQHFLTGTNALTFAVDGAHIYWTDLVNGDRIGRANLDGTAVDPNFITGASGPIGVAADGAHVYWTNSNTHSIGRANLDGTGVDQRFIDVGLNRLPVGLAVDAGHVYWADIVADKIGRANIDGTGVNPDFAPTGPFPIGVAVDSAHIYWTNQFPSPDGLTGGTIGRANLDGTGVTQTFLAGLADPEGVAVDAGTQTAQPSRISIDDVIATEGDAGLTAFRFTVSLEAPQSAPVTVDFATADGTATAPSDYTGTRGTLTFAPGETAKTVTVQVNGDTTVEPNETFNLNLSNATGNATIADAQGVGTIANDDQAPSRISINDVTMAEGNTGQTAFRFTASLDVPQPAPVTVGFITSDITATTPIDYTAAAAALTFAPGETAKTVTVQVNGDTAVEPDETFAVNLANGTVTGNATIADAQGVGTIVNDDQAPSRISINDVTMAEGNAGQTAFRFTVSLDTQQAAPVTVDLGTADGTATAPGDYAAANGTVTFAPGENAKTVIVQVNGDTTVEPDETVTLNLANATGNATIAEAQGIGTIANDDQPVIVPPSRISVNDVTTAEGNAGQTAFRFTVSLDAAQSAPVTVDFATANGTATAPSDYAATSDTLTFAPGETTKTVTVHVNGDTRKEPNETFNLNLANATGNATIADAKGVGTIVNDDRKHRHNRKLAHALQNHRTVTRRLEAIVHLTGKPVFLQRGKVSYSRRG
jgi:Calx-beta domain